PRRGFEQWSRRRPAGDSPCRASWLRWATTTATAVPGSPPIYCKPSGIILAPIPSSASTGKGAFTSNGLEEQSMEPNHQQPQPTIFVLFGAGGDLSWRLILPALFNLYLDKYLPEQWLLIGIDRQD